MQRITVLSLISLLAMALMCLPLVLSVSEVGAQDTTPQFTDISAKASGIIQDVQEAVSTWNSNYYVGSIEELMPARNPGLAATGQYSSVFPAASLQFTEMPYSIRETN